jgi:UDPglucose 6-dehydrogenase
VKRICVVGTGYVGLTTGTCFADLGNLVTCIDVDPKKVADLRAGILPIFEPGLEELVDRNARAGRLIFTTDCEDAVPEADFVFVAVGTPESDNGAAELGQVEAAVQSIAHCLNGHTIIVNKSTVPIGTGDLVAALIEKYIGSEASFAVVSNPEFLREGSAISDFMDPDRIVLGSTDRQAAEKVSELYQALNAPIIITDLRTAEMIKYASNAILATRISFMNEIAHICERLGADVKQVAVGMGADKRIGPQFLHAGIGFGGSCFPKDVKALAYMAASASCHPQLLHAVMDINRDQRRLFVEKVESVLGSVAAKSIAVWGLSFKPNTDDMREAPSVDIIKRLQAKGARVRAYDPVACPVAQALLPEVEFADNPYAAAEGTDALLLLTEWNEFKQVDMAKVKATMRQAVLIDGRNLYEPCDMRALGFEYRGVGRGC